MKQRLWAGAALFTAVTGGMDHFISAAALKAPHCGREWICISKKPILCLDQGCPNSVLEGRCPAEFSSNPN